MILILCGLDPELVLLAQHDQDSRLDHLQGGQLGYKVGPVHSGVRVVGYSDLPAEQHVRTALLQQDNGRGLRQLQASAHLAFG